jgi:hypothetical protein
MTWEAAPEQISLLAYSAVEVVESQRTFRLHLKTP